MPMDRRSPPLTCAPCMTGSSNRSCFGSPALWRSIRSAGSKRKSCFWHRAFPLPKSENNNKSGRARQFAQVDRPVAAGRELNQPPWEHEPQKPPWFICIFTLYWTRTSTLAEQILSLPCLPIPPRRPGEMGIEPISLA